MAPIYSTDFVFHVHLTKLCAFKNPKQQNLRQHIVQWGNKLPHKTFEAIMYHIHNFFSLSIIYFSQWERKFRFGFFFGNFTSILFLLLLFLYGIIFFGSENCFRFTFLISKFYFVLFTFCWWHFRFFCFFGKLLTSSKKREF